METQDLLCRAACRGLVAAGLFAVGYASAEAQSVVGQTPTHVHGINISHGPIKGKKAISCSGIRIG